MERTGHRSLEGVRSYKRTSESQKEALSDILNTKPSMQEPQSSDQCTALIPAEQCEDEIHLKVAPGSHGQVNVQQNTGDHSKGLTEFESFTVLQSILHKPTAYLDEKLFDIIGKWVHLSTICRTIKQHGFSRKKVQTIALQPSEKERNICLRSPYLIQIYMLIWIDETGSDQRKGIHTFGHSRRGI